MGITDVTAAILECSSGTVGTLCRTASCRACLAGKWQLRAATVRKENLEMGAHSFHSRPRGSVQIPGKMSIWKVAHRSQDDSIFLDGVKQPTAMLSPMGIARSL
eukprot:s3145_g3.t1